MNIDDAKKDLIELHTKILVELLSATTTEAYSGEPEVNWQAEVARSVCSEILIAAKVRTYGGCLFCQG